MSEQGRDTGQERTEVIQALRTLIAEVRTRLPEAAGSGDLANKVEAAVEAVDRIAAFHAELVRLAPAGPEETHGIPLKPESVSSIRDRVSSGLAARSLAGPLTRAELVEAFEYFASVIRREESQHWTRRGVQHAIDVARKSPGSESVVTALEKWLARSL